MMRRIWRDWRILGGLASALAFAVVFTWLSLFAGAGYDGDDVPPMLPRLMISFGLTAPLLAILMLANVLARPRAVRASRGFEVMMTVDDAPQIATKIISEDDAGRA